MGAPLPDTQAAEDGAFLALHDERESLERALALVVQRQRFSSDPEDAARACEEEAALLASLDRVMTMIRAAEYKRGPGARRW